MNLHTRVALALVAGVVVGALAGPGAEVLEPLGTLFIRLVRMVIVPLVASSLVVAIAGLPGRAALGRMGLRAFGFITISLLVALVLGIGFGLVFQPGAGFFNGQAPSGQADGGAEQAVPPAATEKAPERPSLVETLIDVVPANMLGAAAQGNMLQVLFVSVALGLGTSVLPEAKRKPLIDVLAAVAEVMVWLVGRIMLLAPFGIFGLIAAVVGRSGLSVVGNLGYYLLVVVAALATHAFGTYGLVLVALARQKVARFYRIIRPPLLITFGTCSTSAALPVSLKVMQTEMGLSPRVASFVIPLGTAVGRDGSGIYQAISVLFIAQAYGHGLGPSALATLVVTAMLSALAVASVPAASFVNLAIILTALGLPLEGAALVLGVERPLDMLRSSVNLVGQLTGATYVAAAEGEISPAASTAPVDNEPSQQTNA
ncbi:MAG: dicarboxylate/amino acid:cation symporter [Acidobacteriota bacterium]